MRMLAYLACAATAALVPSLASAQTTTAPPAGHSWREGVAREMRHAPVRIDRQHRGGRRFAHIPRIQRGFIVPQMWWGPQFVVRNWSNYGFPQPFAGGRWIRYYDDALLIDRAGRVRDGRYGWDWDRYDDEWDYDERGVPVYAGDGDFKPELRDHAWVEGHDRREGHARGDYGRGHHPGPPSECRSGPCRPGPVYGHGYPPPPPSCHNPCGGHGYGWSGPVVVTETITTTAPVVETRTYYEYVEEEVSSPRPARRHRARRPAAPARPGERG